MRTTQDSPAASPTKDDLIARARAMVPELKERAGQADKSRRISDETVAAIRSNGFLRAGSPDRYGGFGLDCDAIFEVEAELGRGCGATAWCLGVWGIHNWATGLFPLEAQEEYYGDQDVISSSSYYPDNAEVRPEKGGFRISGRWSFSSGCDQATWVTLGGVGPSGLLWFLVPSSDYAIDDTWFVAGLKGTGSKDIVIEDAFVPEHRVLDFGAASEGTAPGRAIHDRPGYRVPMMSALSFTIASPTIGMAQGAIDEYASQLHQRSAPGTGSLVNSVAAQLRLAESAVEVEAARALMRQAYKEVLERGRREETFSLLDRARNRRNQAFIGRLCVRAADRVFEAAGGHALYESNPIQRFYRDIHAAAHHVALQWDVSGAQYGRLALGLEPLPGSRI